MHEVYHIRFNSNGNVSVILVLVYIHDIRNGIGFPGFYFKSLVFLFISKKIK